MGGSGSSGRAEGRSCRHSSGKDLRVGGQVTAATADPTVKNNWSALQSESDPHCVRDLNTSSLALCPSCRELNYSL